MEAEPVEWTTALDYGALADAYPRFKPFVSRWGTRGASIDYTDPKVRADHARSRRVGF